MDCPFPFISILLPVQLCSCSGNVLETASSEVLSNDLEQGACLTDLMYSYLQLPLIDKRAKLPFTDIVKNLPYSQAEKVATFMVSFEGSREGPCWKIWKPTSTWNSFKEIFFFLVSSALFLKNAEVPCEIPNAWLCSCYQIILLLDSIKPDGYLNPLRAWPNYLCLWRSDGRFWFSILCC